MVKPIIGLLILVCLLTACQNIKKEYRAVMPNRDVTYLEQKSIPPLVLPQGLTLQHGENFYPIPEGELPTPGAKPIDITPPGLDDILKTEHTS